MDQPRSWWLIIAVVAVCALLVGTALGIAAYYSWELNAKVDHLNREVTQLIHVGR